MNKNFLIHKNNIVIEIYKNNSVIEFYKNNIEI